MTKIKNPNSVKQLIIANPTEKRSIPHNEEYLDIAEFFCDTIQGENFVGYPASFLRLQYCTLCCVFCDTKSVWRYGNPYSFSDIFKMMEDIDLIRKMKEGQHLIFTGGSPLKQQDKIISFINLFINKYGFKPFIEIENECTLFPEEGLINLVDIWNNSPKLKNSRNLDSFRYKPEVLKKLSILPNSWFKFVLSKEEDWTEIKNDFIDKGLIQKNQIVLMPLGGDIQELEDNRHFTVELAIRENVRYTTREHVVLWNTLTGV